MSSNIILKFTASKKSVRVLDGKGESEGCSGRMVVIVEVDSLSPHGFTTWHRGRGLLIELCCRAGDHCEIRGCHVHLAKP